MDNKSLAVFLSMANQAGYANTDTKITDADDGGHLINFTDGDWHYCDYFYGGEPYAGQEVVYYQNKPVWAAQYRGWLNDTDQAASDVYGFLRRALSNNTSGVRGPAEWSEGDWKYTNKMTGELENCAGEERIYYRKKHTYTAKYFGGWIDKL